MEYAPSGHRRALYSPNGSTLNGHLNMAYYSVLMDNAVDDASIRSGSDQSNQKTGQTTYVAEFHVCLSARVLQGRRRPIARSQWLDF